MTSYDPDECKNAVRIDKIAVGFRKKTFLKNRKTSKKKRLSKKKRVKSVEVLKKGIEKLKNVILSEKM